ncbi:MAG: Na+/H+ antiporter [Gemmatales bacterium]
MLEVPTILGLLTVVTLLALLAPRLRIPIPTCMVLGGLAISLIPGLPEVDMPPELVFLVFLPPLLYAAAWQMPWQDFKRNLRPILQLAIGLVLITALGVAVTIKWMVPEMSWAFAFALGGILGPPDAVAATSVTRGLGVPQRLVTILEGESLVNDATGLVIYKLGIAAAITGTFVFLDAVGLFLMTAIGGVIVGYLLGHAVTWIHRHLDEPTVETVLTLLTPYAAYLAAEQFHWSGVLATVTAGIHISRRQQEYFSPTLRLQATSVWNTLDFILNGLAFVLIGLQLPTVLRQLQREESLLLAASITLVVYLAMVTIRMLWIWPAAWLPRVLSSRIRRREPMPKPSALVVIGWCGMRGVVSLAAALAIPHTMADGSPFPFRGMLLAITFGVVLGTLVIQGLTLAPLVRWLKLSNPQYSGDEEELQLRLELVAAAISYLETQEQYALSSPQMVARVREHFERQGELWLSQMAMQHVSKEDAAEMARPSRELYLGAICAQRRLLHRMRDSGRVHGPGWQRLLDAVDLEEARFRIALGAKWKDD